MDCVWLPIDAIGLCMGFVDLQHMELNCGRLAFVSSAWILLCFFADLWHWCFQWVRKNRDNLCMGCAWMNLFPFAFVFMYDTLLHGVQTFCADFIGLH